MDEDSTTSERYRPEPLAAAIEAAGVAGGGRAGFPSYVKWQGVDDVDYQLINHQESEAFIDPGERVRVGDVIAEPPEGLGNTQHASVAGQ